MTEEHHIGEVVAQWRKAAGMSREAFAQHTGLTPGAVWRIEVKGTLKPGEDTKLHQVLEQNPVVITKTPSPTIGIVQQITIVDATDVPPDDDKSTSTSHASHNHPTVTSSPVYLPELPGFAEKSPTQLTLEDGFFRFSNSEIQTFKRCRRKWWFVYYRNLTPKSESPVGPRAIGDRVHRALRFHYAADPAEQIDVQDALEALIFQDWKSVVEFYADDEMYEGDVPLAISSQFTKDANLERIMIEGYLQWLAETGSDSEYEVTGSEVYLEADLPNIPGVKIIARLDARVRRISDNVRFFMDHKTVGAFQQLTKVVHMNEQMMMYILIEMLQPDPERIAGALYNMMRRVKRGPAAKPPFYERMTIHHNPKQIESFQTRLTGTVETIMSARTRLDSGTEPKRVVYPSPTKDCTWDCPFFEACGMMDDGSYAEGLIRQFFQQGDPLGYYAKGNLPG